jgi:LmbE family N-acetylglucosaminyl deacetylase
MAFRNSGSEIYAPRYASAEEAFARVTHLAVGAHADDVEIFAAQPILECYDGAQPTFAAVIVSDGRGSVRTGCYADVSDDDLRELRKQEQKAAADLGRYAATIFLDYTSEQVRAPGAPEVVGDLELIFKKAQPEAVYTHSPCDRHDTHVATFLRTLAALRNLPAAGRPQQLIACEVWGGLDWLPEAHKVLMETSEHHELQRRLLEAFQSQLAGGKRYDLAAMGRRRANATFHQSHDEDRVEGAILGWDLSQLLADEEQDPETIVAEMIDEFRAQVLSRLKRFG